MPFSSLHVRGDMWPPMLDSCLARRLLEFVQDDGLSQYSMKWIEMVEYSRCVDMVVPAIFSVP